MHPGLVSMPLWPQADFLYPHAGEDWKSCPGLRKLGSHGIAALGKMLEMSTARLGPVIFQ